MGRSFAAAIAIAAATPGFTLRRGAAAMPDVPVRGRGGCWTPADAEARRAEEGCGIGRLLSSSRSFLSVILESC